jgi:hypothetical protein
MPLNVLIRGLRWGAPLAALLAGLASTDALAADPTKDQCVDANGKAQDLRRDDKLQAAYDQLRLCASPACPAIVRDDCARRLDELDKVTPSIVFEAKDGAGHDLNAVKVTVDGKLLTDNLGGTALAVDPGPHAFTFEVAGQAPVTQQFVLHEGEKNRIERVVIGAPPLAAQGGVAAQPSPEAAAAAPGPDTTRRTIGIVTAGAGVVLLGVFGVFEAKAASKDSDSKAAAVSPDPTVQATTGSLYDSAKSAQTIGYVMGGVGLAAVATGAVLFFTSGAPSTEKAASLRFAPRVGPGSGGLDVIGTF